MFGIGGFEFFLILLFGFLIFGPDKLPSMAKTIGRGIAKFRSAQREMSDVLKDGVFDPDSDEPFKDPTEAVSKIVSKHVPGMGKAGNAKPAAAQAATSSAAPSAAGAGAGTTAAGAAAARATGAAEATGSAQPTAAPARQESFTERKARYERERAARKAAEAQGEQDAASSTKEGE
ncbi:twin-arginine translocase TatA/TatE family subunit [Eggerthellaceae bacterium zg-1084]|uniref:Sec-independent protein translocase subunit TatA/TatB n=1 Tax=Berryella wangjianweii TaxID=2734634 RepID=UPI001556E1AB|nr:twin-arginine translocase TatA/TatE family subunit [Berryella wangjianweii]NPD30580.1 twin-arginine translocase TatA/TatE family subunit [Berryella wangjianweii]